MSTPTDSPSPRAGDALPASPSLCAWLYVLRLTSGLLYIGVTTDPESRWAEHAAGKAPRITSANPPQGVVFWEHFATLGEARTRERQLKRWSRAKKEVLIAGHLDSLRRLSRGH